MNQAPPPLPYSQSSSSVSDIDIDIEKEDSNGPESRCCAYTMTIFFAMGMLGLFAYSGLRIFEEFKHYKYSFTMAVIARVISLPQFYGIYFYFYARTLHDRKFMAGNPSITKIYILLISSLIAILGACIESFAENASETSGDKKRREILFVEQFLTCGTAISAPFFIWLFYFGDDKENSESCCCSLKPWAYDENAMNLSIIPTNTMSQNIHQYSPQPQPQMQMQGQPPNHLHTPIPQMQAHPNYLQGPYPPPQASAPNYHQGPGPQAMPGPNPMQGQYPGPFLPNYQQGPPGPQAMPGPNPTQGQYPPSQPGPFPPNFQQGPPPAPFSQPAPNYFPGPQSQNTPPENTKN